MDLIERDKLIEILAEMQGRCATKAALVQNSKIWQRVKDMPTVEAIPISWIQTKADSWNAELKNACPEDAETIRHIQDTYLGMIEEWRKEE